MDQAWRNSAPLPGLLSTGLFLVLGLLFLWYSYRQPIGDYANYYYASRLYIQGQFTEAVYDPFTFNQSVAPLSPEAVFVNYTPVPPVSVLAYLPLALFDRPHLSKLAFNLVCLLVFCLAYHRLLAHLGINRQWWALLVPWFCFFPMLNNFHQGQSYLLLLAFMMEGFIHRLARVAIARLQAGSAPGKHRPDRFFIRHTRISEPSVVPYRRKLLLAGWALWHHFQLCLGSWAAGVTAFQ